VLEPLNELALLPDLLENFGSLFCNYTLVEVHTTVIKLLARALSVQGELLHLALRRNFGAVYRPLQGHAMVLFLLLNFLPLLCDVPFFNKRSVLFLQLPLLKSLH